MSESAPVRPPDAGRISHRHWLRFAIVALVIAGLIWFASRHLTELRTVVQTLARGRWQWLLAAAFVQVGYYVLYAFNYRLTLKSAGVSVRIRDILPAVLAALVVGEIAPLGWAAGGATLLRYLAYRSGTAAGATVGALLAQSADLLAFTIAFGIGLVILVLRHDVSTVALAGAGILALMDVALGGVLLLTAVRPDLATALIRRVPRAGSIADNLAEVGRHVRANARYVGIAFGVALASHAVNILSLRLIFVAFAQPIGLEVLIAGYGAGTLAWMVSPIPTGAGLVEGAIAVTFTSLGIPAASATVIAIAYRGISFWLPMAAGVLCLRGLGRRPGHS